LLDKSFANMMRFQQIGTKLFPRLRSEKVALAGPQRKRTSDGTCFRFQYNVISLRLGLISVGAAFQPRLKNGFIATFFRGWKATPTSSWC
jgi:hypothetical protein